MRKDDRTTGRARTNPKQTRSPEGAPALGCPPREWIPAWRVPLSAAPLWPAVPVPRRQGAQARIRTHAHTHLQSTESRMERGLKGRDTAQIGDKQVPGETHPPFFVFLQDSARHTCACEKGEGKGVWREEKGNGLPTEPASLSSASHPYYVLLSRWGSIELHTRAHKGVKAFIEAPLAYRNSRQIRLSAVLDAVDGPRRTVPSSLANRIAAGACRCCASLHCLGKREGALRDRRQIRRVTREKEKEKKKTRIERTGQTRLGSGARTSST
ncbi:hypothetical protein VTK73DRAFT_6340 [Phialemonium thermophilum]|uniref:Uncharacterized protein n=1 Tax=Phialemonium thermophilum TaxID=223376 RepID=A0ABR3UZM3_9PEZI